MGADVCTVFRIPLAFIVAEATGAGTDGTLMIGGGTATLPDEGSETGAAAKDDVGAGICGADGGVEGTIAAGDGGATVVV